MRGWDALVKQVEDLFRDDPSFTGTGTGEDELDTTVFHGLGLCGVEGH